MQAGEAQSKPRLPLQLQRLPSERLRSLERALQAQVEVGLQTIKDVDSLHRLMFSAASELALREELGGLGAKELQARASSQGVSTKRIEAALHAKSPQSALVALIMEQLPTFVPSKPAGPTPAGPGRGRPVAGAVKDARAQTALPLPVPLQQLPLSQLQCVLQTLKECQEAGLQCIDDVAALRELLATSCDTVGGAEPSSATQAKDDKSNRREKKSTSKEAKGHPVMGKYIMLSGTEDVMGEGTSSICRRGFIRETGEEVAIKVYKNKQDKTIQRKFERQIRVLEELQEPFQITDDPSLWHEELGNSSPSRLFMRLLDYSKDSKGHPGPDPSDGVMYVVTELGQYSLKDFLAHRRDQSEPLNVDLVRRVTQAIIHVMAGLHAKSFVHLDLKPENLMMFNGRLKLIDVDGCMRRGDRVAITDESISFSPVYCAPEWANFLIEEEDEDLPEDVEPTIQVVPGLDVWSAGMTICELVTLDPVLKPMYAKFMRSGTSRDEASFMFMDWLSSLKKAPLTKSILKFDKEFVDLLANHLLVCDKEKRRTCAETLGHPFIALEGADEDEEADVNSGEPAQRELARQVTPAIARRKDRVSSDIPDDSQVERRNRKRNEDHSDNARIHQGTLWKLNTGADPKDPTQWIKRDMWVSSKGSLCYYSVVDSKRLILIDSADLMEATIERFPGGHHQIAFEVRTNSESDEEAHNLFQFACDTENELQEWVRIIKSVSNLENLSTLRLGTGLKAGLKVFKLKVKNRRRPVDGDAAAQYKPVFKASLWKVKAEGSRMNDEDWFLREMWIAQNGSLVYWSKKEERELVYYTNEDISGASFLKVPDAESSKPFTFMVQLPPSDGVEFTPGEFAATSQELQDTWLSELAKISA